MNLIGKTISGVIAAPGQDGAEPQRIWLLQFTDGTHVEFVSPKARRELRGLASKARRAPPRKPVPNPQLTLNVA